MLIVVALLLHGGGAPVAADDDRTVLLQWAPGFDPNDHVIAGREGPLVWGGIREWSEPRWRHTAVWWDERGQIRYVLPGTFEHDGFSWRLTMTRSVDLESATILAEAECVEWTRWLVRQGRRPGASWDGPREASFVITKESLARRSADFNRDGEVNVADYIAFVSAWVAQSSDNGRGDLGDSDSTERDPKDRIQRVDPD